jgi:4'-phosphopantetheinyl transferase
MARLAAMLSSDELHRAGRYRFALHRDRFIAGRGFLREVLGLYLGSRPETLTFRTGPFGKPELEGLHFNVAHAEDRILIAVAAEPVGVDIERVRPMPEVGSLAEQVFSSDEFAAWQEFPPGRRHDAFFWLWTRKEALLKGIGLGISQHLKDVSVFFGTEDGLRAPRELGGEAWSVSTFVEGPDCWSIALCGPIQQIVKRHLA